ncbi:protein of unknown function DUF46 [Ignisphaera aggregans DSM 17230]|uniref:CDP-archaeol synthase n=1 Tax=Ignisphaera aggregans (strain DSM 17230 / JCM 13409 / AQ1.S1) TaxID=583356 RepID=E0SNZ9_IGNAA|nr:protein of unknown function DUF46 [Ignisphaera aggregans DSM 17230]
MDIYINNLIHIIWIIIPAYIANGTPVVVSKLLSSRNIARHPIDFGKTFIDGRRVLGDSKSWEGLISGIIAGLVTSLIQYLIEGNPIAIVRGFILSIGAMAGDIIGAFIKRRIGLKPGEPLPIVDQLMFIIIALSLAIIFKLIRITLTQFIFVLLLTFLLHIATNYIAYKLNLKDVPW